MDIKKLKKFYKDKRVFVTGHTGFKGTWLCLILNYLGANVTGYSLKQSPHDNFYFYKTLNLKKKIKSYYGNILDKKKLLSIIKRNKPVLLVEIEEKHSKKNVKESINFINSLGYKSYYLSGLNLESTNKLNNYEDRNNYFFIK